MLQKAQATQLEFNPTADWPDVQWPGMLRHEGGRMRLGRTKENLVVTGYHGLITQPVLVAAAATNNRFHRSACSVESAQ